MRLSTTTLALALAVAASTTVSAQAAPVSVPAQPPRPAQLPADSMQIALKYIVWLYTAHGDSIVAHMDSASRAEPSAARDIDDVISEIAAENGYEVKLLEEKFITRRGNRQYWRKAMFSRMTEPFLIRIVMNAKGEWAGLGLGLASQAPPIDP